MKPDVKKIIADIKATKGNRKFCNGLAGTLQDDNYASSICKYVKTVTPERIDLLIEYAEKLEAEVTDMAVQLANAESKCRELAAENAGLKQRTQQLIDIISNTDNDYCMCGSAMKDHVHSGCGNPNMAMTLQKLDIMIEHSVRAAIEISHRVDWDFSEAERKAKAVN